MKTTLIKPNIGRLAENTYIDLGRMEPLTIGALAGMTPADIDIAFYDDRIDTIPSEITCETGS